MAILDLSVIFLYRQFCVPLKPVASSSALENKTALITEATTGFGLKGAEQLLSSSKLGCLIKWPRDLERAEIVWKELSKFDSRCAVEI